MKNKKDDEYYESRSVLPVGTIIMLDGVQYKIGDIISSGGSCIFYSVKKEGSFLLLRSMSRTGMFLPELIEKCALPPEKSFPSGVRRLPIHITANILKQVLRALQLVHQAGYVYGDLQSGNLFFADPQLERGDVGFCALLDFGCTRLLDADTQKAVIADHVVFTTPGFGAPELFFCDEIGPEADYYSAGRLFLFLLKGRTYFENGHDRVFAEPYLKQLLPYEAEKLGCTGEVLRLIQSILDNSLSLEPAERDGERLYADAEELFRLTRPPRNHLALSYSALPEGDFLGREDVMEQIDSALRQKRPAVLYGFAGMGKTEAAIRFASHWEKRRLGQANFVHFKGNVRGTVTGPIADGFSGYDRRDIHGKEKPEAQIYREVMKLLGERSENDLLILDNMDAEEPFDALRGEPAFRELCALPMALLVTTRSQAEGGIPVDALPRPLLRQLLGRFVKLSDEIADALIVAVEGHTLTVELIGRTLKTSIPRLSPEVLLEKLREGDLDSQMFAKVSSPKDREGKFARIQGHLSTLFRLSELSEEEKRTNPKKRPSVKPNRRCFPCWQFCLPLLRSFCLLSLCSISAV